MASQMPSTRSASNLGAISFSRRISEGRLASRAALVTTDLQDGSFGLPRFPRAIIALGRSQRVAFTSSEQIGFSPRRVLRVFESALPRIKS
jgi:hypothetical protein